MERELEKTLLEIECSIKDHERRGNTHTQSVLEQARDIVGMCARTARTPSELQQMLRQIPGKDAPDKCGEWSRRKWYQEGYKDGSKDNDWIPVEERLPEEAGTYIINALAGERNIVTFAKWQNRYKRFDMTGARTYWKIIAWCPLPEPYRQERSEE